MSLLPQLYSEFSEAEYWEKFFHKRGAKEFEWYGNYEELIDILHKYTKKQDTILHAGCGNSRLGVELQKIGYKSILNADVSQTVINQMSSQYPDAKFVCMDLLKTGMEGDSFTVVLDKGTLDALASEDNEESCQRAISYFGEMDRMLKFGGRFICVSLLQSHVVRTVLSYFPNKHWMIKVIRCQQAEAKDAAKDQFVFPVFVVVCTKLKPMPKAIKVLEFCPDGDLLDQSERIFSEEALQNRIKSVQDFAMVAHKMTRVTVADDQFISLFDPSNPTSPKYSLYVTDRKRRVLKSMAVFIVTQGSETDWLFGTPTGREELATQANADRLIVVHLNRGHNFTNLETVQNELKPYIVNLRPSTLPENYIINFLSSGGELGQREVVYKGQSNFSGDFVVEDIKDDDGIVRRLIFLNRPNIIQSELNLDSKTVLPSCVHHIIMTSSLYCLDNQDSRTLIIGLGGGELVKYIRKLFPKMVVDVADIDEAMVKVAKDFFGFVTDERMHVHIADGLQLIEDSYKKGIKYDCIMFDVDSKDRSIGISCPPIPFISLDFLKIVQKCLTSSGLFILNLVARDIALKEDIKKRLETIFNFVHAFSILNEVNEVIICANDVNSVLITKSKNKVDKKNFKPKFRKAVENATNSVKFG